LAGWGGGNRRVVAAMSVCGSNHRRSCYVVSSTYRFSHGRWQSDQKHGKKKIVVGVDSMRAELLKFALENARLEAIHALGESHQFKIGLLFAFVKFPPQNGFEIIKKLLRVIACINCV
jgi:thioredoxin reductase